MKQYLKYLPHFALVLGRWLSACAITVSLSVAVNAQEQTSVSKMTIDQCLALSAEKEQAGDLRDASRYLNEVADRYWEEKNYDDAIKYYNRSLEMNRKVFNENGIAGIESNLGMIYFDKGEYEESLVHFQATYKYRYEHNEKASVVSALINMSVVYNKIKRYDDAIKVLEEAASTAREMNNLDQMRSCYGMLAEANTNAGNTDKAVNYLQLYNTVHETLSNRIEERVSQANTQAQLAEANQRLADLELKYKQQEIDERDRILKSKDIMLDNLDFANRELLLNKTKSELLIDNLKISEENAELMRAQAEDQLRNERLKNSVLYAGLGIAILFAVVIFLYSNQKRKINKRLASQNAEIRESRNMILEQKSALENAYVEISQKNEDITHSIDYAEYIQKAFLHSPHEIKQWLPDSFVYTQPCAIVSGDFMWCKHIGHKMLVACVDCTGHGVSGAFMSLIGSNLLTQIVDQGQSEPDQILNTLNIAIFHALRKQESKLHSGMDMALYCIDYEKDELSFAGAKMPLIYIRNGEMYKIPGNISPIGGDWFTSDKDFDSFTKRTIPLDAPTWVYVASDGYASQFSFSGGKKFQSGNFRKLLLEIHQKPMAEQKEILQKTMDNWIRSGDLVDDILVIGAKIDLGAKNI